jgi:hypothetical protein
MKQLGLFLLFALLLSCSSTNGVKMNLHNSSGFTISEIQIGTSDSLAKIKIQKLNNNEKVSEFLNMEKVKRIDGNYIIEYKINDSTYKKEFGYYTNGYPPELEINITIKPNTILVNQNHKKY